MRKTEHIWLILKFQKIWKKERTCSRCPHQAEKGAASHVLLQTKFNYLQSIGISDL